MVEVNTTELYNAITSLKDEVVELKLSTQKDNADTRLEIAVSKNTQEQMRTDLIQLKTEVSKMREDINIIKQESAENRGEKNKSNYFKEKLFWPIVMLVLAVVINPLITKIISPTPVQTQYVVQSVTPTPPSSVNK